MGRKNDDDRRKKKSDDIEMLLPRWYRWIPALPLSPVYWQPLVPVTGPWLQAACWPQPLLLYYSLNISHSSDLRIPCTGMDGLSPDTSKYYKHGK